MNATTKQKICWNCEGRVSLDQENCPFCAVYLGLVPTGKGERDILAPPYRLVDSEVDTSKESIPSSPYAMKQEGKTDEQEGIEMTSVRTDLQKVVYPLIMLSGGSILFLFGFILLFFSNQDLFTLSWNAKHWYFYLGLGLPMLFAGWKFLQRFNEEDEPSSID